MSNDEFGSENSSLGGRVKRYARVGTSVGGLAAQLVGSRFLGFGLDKGQHSAELKQALGGLKGPLMKAAQILATIPDALPKEYATELRELQSNAPPMGWPFVKRRMRSELGADWQTKFASFEREAGAAASLGQVHRALGHDGSRLACKLQYPDMASAVEADLDQLKVLFSIYRRYDKAIDPSDIYKELSDRLREEVDYDREARHMRLYAAMLAEEEAVHVPDPVAELSTDRLLTMTWLDGRGLMDFVAATEDPEARRQVALNMFRAWYVPFYYFGVIHGDPHLGNYTVRDDLGINLLDFGCIRVFPPRFVRGVIDLYRALEHRRRSLGGQRLRDLGLLRYQQASCWTRSTSGPKFLYAPLLEDKPQPIMGDDSVMYGANVAGKVQSRS